jgi:hypothetical protein
MPYFAHLGGDFHCPVCGAVPAGSDDPRWAVFTWGFCRGGGFPGRRPYRVGDPLLWGKLPNGTTPAWTLFPDGGANIGDPAIRRLIYADSYSWRSICGRKCAGCGAEFGAVAVEVEDLRITSASIIASGSPLMVAQYHVYQADGSWLPMEDHDRPFEISSEPASIPDLPP